MIFGCLKIQKYCKLLSIYSQNSSLNFWKILNFIYLLASGQILFAKWKRPEKLVCRFIRHDLIWFCWKSFSREKGLNFSFSLLKLTKSVSVFPKWFSYFRCLFSNTSYMFMSNIITCRQISVTQGRGPSAHICKWTRESKNRKK